MSIYFIYKASPTKKNTNNSAGLHNREIFQPNFNRKSVRINPDTSRFNCEKSRFLVNIRVK